MGHVMTDNKDKHQCGLSQMIITDEVPCLGSNRIHVEALRNHNTMRKGNCNCQIQSLKKGDY